MKVRSAIIRLVKRAFQQHGISKPEESSFQKESRSLLDKKSARSEDSGSCRALPRLLQENPEKIS